VPTLSEVLDLQIQCGGPGSGRHKQFYGKRPKIAIDFDGVIHQYTGYSKKLNPPMVGALEGIKALQKAGMDVVVHSARPSSQIRPWLKEHGFPPLQVTNKKPVARAYLDDRAVNFGSKGWSKGLVDKLVNFKTHWEKQAEQNTKIHATIYGPQTGTTNWSSPSGPTSPDWFDVVIGISPIPNDHPPSLKNPIKTKIPLSTDGWHKDDSKAAKKQARQDLVELHKRMRRQYGKPEIAETAQMPLYPTLMDWM